VWPFIADTERVNKAAGLAVVQFDDLPLAEGGVCRMGHFDFLGLRVEWEEKPFEWQHGEWLRVERVYQRGPMLRLTTDFRLTATPTGSEVRATVSAQPRGVWAVPLLRLQVGGAVFAGFDRTLRHLDAHLQGRTRFPYPDDPPRLTYGAELVAERAREAMLSAGVDAQVAEHVVELAIRWPDRDVERVRPHVEAARLGVPRPRVLRALLVAADAGLYELLWDIRCPHCQGGPRSKRLGAVQVRNSCQSCNLSFAAKFDHEIAVTFTPSPRVRQLDLSDHCVGGPGKTPHVVAQLRLAPGAEAELWVPARPARWRLRSPWSERSAELQVVNDGASELEVAVHSTGFVVSGAVRPGGRLRLSNLSQHEQVVSLDDPTYHEAAVTGAQVAALQDFRTRFIGEVMAPDQSLAVDSMTFLFTDLRSSTAMYERVGDGGALDFVRRHFEELFDCVDGHDGAVVKTVGDAVMAVFDDPGDAVQAAVAMVQRVAKLTNAAGDPLILRVGVHRGGCLAVNMDGRLDYFGSTVNRAARVEHESRGNDVICSLAVLDDPRAAHALAALQVERYEASLRGVPEPVTLGRITVPGVVLPRQPRSFSRMALPEVGKS
jgi:class 3 adenylate cyclase